MNLDQPISVISIPTIGEYKIEDLSESIVSLSENNFKCRPMYFEQGYKEALNDCYARQGIVNMLYKAKELLPIGYDFLIYDGWRPISIQQELWDKQMIVTKKEHPESNEKELEYYNSFFVSKPSYDISNPSLHNTGGSIDLTLTKDGKAIDMGTEFDAFGDKCWTAYYEQHELDNKEIRMNRRLLYNIMIAVGFTNLPSEWWHYDYGTKFWAYYKNQTALYKGILELN